MNITRIAKASWLPALLLVLFLTAVFFRPLFPVDETRYMTVAWEMLLHHGWLDPLTLNFEPYHHKPPFIFWLINLSWAVFGVSRWAGLIPTVLASLACVYLTAQLGKTLFPERYNQQRLWLVMAGSLPFIFYSTLVMFDFTLCVFVLLSLLSLLLFRQTRQWRYAALLGLSLGLGVLTKGPVDYLYVLPVALLAPFWAKPFIRPKAWYAGILLALIVSAGPVLLWLIPVLKESDGDFMRWLVWNQTAGRITGNFTAAHARPFWFYLPILPLFLMPWVFFPTFWQRLSLLKDKAKKHEGLRFILAFLVPVFVAFSIISGKQPHYLVPLLPGIVLLVEYCLKGVETRTLAKATIALATLFIGAQAMASFTVFKRYSLEPIADIIKTQPNRDLAFVQNYHGEVGFLARRNAPLTDVAPHDIQQWFITHPNGWAIIRYGNNDDKINGLKKVFSYPYRSKNIGLFEK